MKTLREFLLPDLNEPVKELQEVRDVDLPVRQQKDPLSNLGQGRGDIDTWLAQIIDHFEGMGDSMEEISKEDGVSKSDANMGKQGHKLYMSIGSKIRGMSKEIDLARRLSDKVGFRPKGT